MSTFWYMCPLAVKYFCEIYWFLSSRLKNNFKIKNLYFKMNTYWTEAGLLDYPHIV